MLNEFVQTRKSGMSGCFSGVKVIAALMGVGATVFYFVFLGFDEAGIEALLLVGISGYLIYNLFQPKAKTVKQNIKIDDKFLYVADDTIPLATLHVDLYVNRERFYRYHIWDANSKLAIFSIYKDDLVRTLYKSGVEVQSYTEESASSSQAGVSVLCEENRKLFYNLETGKFTISIPDHNPVEIRPKYVIVDPQFRILNKII